VTMALNAATTRRGWVWKCECGRGPMTRGPMQLHLMAAKGHALSMRQAGWLMDAAKARKIHGDK
jgi:hypothetical protein